jgi:hypothetical protein
LPSHSRRQRFRHRVQRSLRVGRRIGVNGVPVIAGLLSRSNDKGPSVPGRANGGPMPSQMHMVRAPPLRGPPLIMTRAIAADDPSGPALSDSGCTGQALVLQREGELSTAVEAAQDFAAASRSKATLRAYRSDWHDFEKWCDRHCLITLPADSRTVAAYLSAMAKGRPAKLATIRRRRRAAAAWLRDMRRIGPVNAGSNPIWWAYSRSSRAPIAWKVSSRRRWCRPGAVVAMAGRSRSTQM